MNIYVVVSEKDGGSLLLCAEVDKAAAEKEAEYHREISSAEVRVTEIELTDKRRQFGGESTKDESVFKFKPSTFSFPELSGKTIEVFTGSDYADGISTTVTMGRDIETRNIYVLDTKSEEIE